MALTIAGSGPCGALLSGWAGVYQGGPASARTRHTATLRRHWRSLARLTLDHDQPPPLVTGMPSTRWPHHSTVPQSCHGCQPQNFRCSVGMESTAIARPHVGHGRLGRGRPCSLSQIGGFTRASAVARNHGWAWPALRKDAAPARARMRPERGRTARARQRGARVLGRSVPPKARLWRVSRARLACEPGAAVGQPLSGPQLRSDTLPHEAQRAILGATFTSPGPRQETR